MTVANYLTDDPWNSAHFAPWFLEALPCYAAVFSPRVANLAQLQQLGCRQVEYLAFGYDPSQHFPDNGIGRTASGRGVVFVGGADPDRIRVCQALAQAGLPLALFGDYWEKSAITRPFACGYADLGALRSITSQAGVNLCLTRRANRDGHTMRSFEIPAMQGVILAERTDDHETIFGREADCALFFTGDKEMVEKAKWLLDHTEEAGAMATRAHNRISSRANTYCDRLQTMLSQVARI